MSRDKKFIHDLKELYKQLFQDGSIETESVDFLLESLHEKGEAIRKKVEDGN